MEKAGRRGSTRDGDGIDGFKIVESFKRMDALRVRTFARAFGGAVELEDVFERFNLVLDWFCTGGGGSFSG